MSFAPPKAALLQGRQVELVLTASVDNVEVNTAHAKMACAYCYVRRYTTDILTVILNTFLQLHIDPGSSCAVRMTLLGRKVQTDFVSSTLELASQQLRLSPASRPPYL